MKRITKRIGALSLVAFLSVGCAMNKSFHIPAGKGDLDTIKTELDGGRDIDSRDAAGQTALMYAAEAGQIEVVKYLVSNGADVNAQSEGIGLGTALIYAASANRLDVMEYLIEQGADVNAMTRNKETALFWASAQGHVEAVKILLKNGAYTELKNKKDQTALDVAKELNRTEVIELLKN
jgi:ankyrin repeat protein